MSVPVRIALLLSMVGLFCGACKEDAAIGTLLLTRALIGDTPLAMDGTVTTDLPIDRSITLVFSTAVEQNSAANAITVSQGGQQVPVSLNFLTGGSSVAILPSGPLNSNTEYIITVSEALRGADGSRGVAYRIHFKTVMDDLSVVSITFADETANVQQAVFLDVPLDLSMKLHFSVALDESAYQHTVTLTGAEGAVGLRFELSEDNTVLSVDAASLKDLTKYELQLADGLRGVGGEQFSAFSKTLYTRVAAEPKFPIISAEELLTLVQRQTFKYFWDFAHPASGMARERNTSGDLVTSGGSGFGIMALIVGMERGFITRAEGLTRLAKIVAFLETADRFHGAWSHWINGNTGKTLPFSLNDNGGDLVETSLLMQGLITARQYLNTASLEEGKLIERINNLWETVEWEWYRRDGQDVLYWHWSPDKGWAMNLPIRGWNESLITYVLAAASPTHSIPKSVYDNGWARGGDIRNGAMYEGAELPLGAEYGGPLFLSQYSFLGIDPRDLSDQYANYWTQNVNHTLINYRYCARNPKNYAGYDASNGAWGLTASDNHDGYSAHSPTNDLGVITPTAALSAFPYTPDESMKALEFFYYTMGDRLWGPYGFYDAFNVTEQWFANSYLAIDQGPIIVMIENHRTGLLWNLFMSAPEVKDGLRKLGFDSPKL